MIKNIVFDIGNVLVDFAWKEYFKGFNPSKEEFERLVNATVNDPYWNEIDRGVKSEEDILEHFIANDPGIENLIRRVYENFDGLLRMFEYTRGWIKDLQNRGFKVYCLSNMSFKAVRECWNDLCFIEELDGYILSCDVKITKPEPGIYTALFEKYKLKPEECIFFDDLERNVEGARKAGMHAEIFSSVKKAEEDIKRICSEQPFKSEYTKAQRMIALTGIAFILLLYILSFVFALIQTPFAKSMFRATLGCTIGIPILCWIYIWLLGKLKKKKTIADFNFFEK